MALTSRAVALCEDVRSVARERLSRHWGAASPATLALVEERLRILLAL
ncbi:MAG: type II toxin-antitoxin system PemK/MazF family toxin [Armatimonadetes bacterium]|nr:type II toxin-antitoxin system PemK/MazF family toxin [Armatimonadota bacterium]